MRQECVPALVQARRLVSDYGLREPEDISVEAIALDLGVYVVEAPLKGSSARLIRQGNGGLVRVNSGIRSEGQKRFCVAHELGHFVLHEKMSQLVFCTSKDMLLGYQQQPEEAEANAFAAELLMPEPFFREKCFQGELRLRTLEGLARLFRTTISATAYRYVELGAHVCAAVGTEKGMIRWVLACPDFGFRLPGRGSRLDARTCAGEFFFRRRGEKTEEDVPAAAWLDDGRVEETWSIREILIPMPYYRSALSVLWVVPGSALDVLD